MNRSSTVGSTASVGRDIGKWVVGWLAEWLADSMGSDDRDDMSGVGSFDRENTTLYVARINTYDDPEVGWCRSLSS